MTSSEESWLPRRQRLQQTPQDRHKDSQRLAPGASHCYARFEDATLIHADPLVNVIKGGFNKQPAMGITDVIRKSNLS